MGIFDGLEPKLVLDYFEKICAIPHGSRNTKAISDYLVAEAARLGVWCRQDELNNVIMVKPAAPGYENAPAVVLQGHMDMVCEKEEGVDIDFEHDGLTLRVDGDFVSASGTTLGGDDGIAVAYILAIMADKRLKHPRLEAVLTVDEEIGMDGAQGIDLSDVKGRILLNMDSEGEGIFLAGCAGGATAGLHLPIQREETTGVVATISLGGLRGGHSGAEIHTGRANANVLMGRVLDALLSAGLIHILGVEGGNKDNAIPRSCKARVMIRPIDFEAIQTILTRLEETFKDEYAITDPEVNIAFEKGELAEAKAETLSSVTRMNRGLVGRSIHKAEFLAREAGLTQDSAARLITLMIGLPNGVQKMSAFIPSLVQTSLNLGILRTSADAATLHYSVRSSVNSEKDALLRRLQLLGGAVGARMTVEGAYPAWPYKADSPLRELMCKTYKEMFGCDARVETIHAGVECGLLSDKLPGMDAISFGPNLFDIHTPSERMSLSSVARTWQFLIRVLANIQ